MTSFSPHSYFQSCSVGVSLSAHWRHLRQIHTVFLMLWLSFREDSLSGITNLVRLKAWILHSVQSHSPTPVQGPAVQKGDTFSSITPLLPFSFSSPLQDRGRAKLNGRKGTNLQCLMLLQSTCPLCVIGSPKLVLLLKVVLWLSGSPIEASANIWVNSVGDLWNPSAFVLMVYPRSPGEGTLTSVGSLWVGASKLRGLATISSILIIQDGGHGRAPSGSSLPSSYTALLQPASHLPNSPGEKQATVSSYIYPPILRNKDLTLPGAPFLALLNMQDTGCNGEKYANLSLLKCV